MSMVSPEFPASQIIVTAKGIGKWQILLKKLFRSSSNREAA